MAKDKAQKKTMYFIQQEGQARIIWNGRKRLVLISAAPNGIFATTKDDVAQVLRHYKYKELTEKELFHMGYERPVPDRIEYRTIEQKYIPWTKQEIATL